MSTHHVPRESPQAGAERAVKLRPATMNDAADLLRWRNDPQTRAMSLSDAIVSLEAHRRWMEAKMSDPASRVYIAEDRERGLSVGVGRLDIVAAGRVLLSLTVDPEQRGRGYAMRIIEQLVACVQTGDAGQLAVLVAEVREENQASLRAFTAAGFEPSGHGDRGLVTLERRS